MSVNRRYGCTRPRLRVGQPQRRRQPGLGLDVQGVHRRRRPVGGLRRELHAQRPAALHLAGVQEERRHARRPATSSATTTPDYASTYNMTSGARRLGQHLLRRPRGRAGQRRGPGGSTAEAMGMHFDDPVNQHTGRPVVHRAARTGSFTLGPDATSPLDLASAYSTRRGQRHPVRPDPGDRDPGPRRPAARRTPTGSPLDTGDHCTPEAITPGVANTLANMMVGVVDRRHRRAGRAIPGHEIAGKTGTTQDNKTAAFVGITPGLRGQRHVLRPAGQERRRRRRRRRARRTIFHDAMAPILAGQPNKPFPPADPAVVGRHPGAAATPTARAAAGPRPDGRQRPAPAARPARARRRAPATPAAADPAGRRPPATTGNPAGRTPAAAAATAGTDVAQPSWRRTSAATRPPSARPATAAVAPRP